ncbi:addiction module antitoxin [Pandoraea aquatica]|uniref:Addiction module antitoxin n=1 Tax=Pandoraea aquatica TaxID=2508290 RepID=A0A5E4YUL9_9BURK|nr:type II toxin-antitoxin system ParD family antitoxin [Pandoraea aquatica]VVE52531.1 addiction module antitoxin [Pandoraea aquatica]
MISAELGRSLEDYIAELVEQGRYGSKSDVLREGVRLIQDRESQLAALDAMVERGIADAAAGKGQLAADVFDRLEMKYQAKVNDEGRSFTYYRKPS